MSERARHLAERVFPEGVRVRQWVLSLPFELRVRAAFDHDLALALCRITTRAIESHYRLEARRAGLSAPRGGSVTLIQRFGSDLRTNLHFHTLCLDGVYVDDGSAQRRFFTPPAPSPADVERVLARVVRKARAYLASRDDVPPADDEELALAQTHAASARTQGAQKHAPDDAEPLDQVLLPTRRKARIERWDLDAEVAVHERERERLEHLCRYALRPPIALGRVKILGNDHIAIELQRKWSDGTTHISMSVHTFLGRLASLVPRPRANTTIYAGVLAANSSDRAAIVPEPQSSDQPHRERRHDASWAALMKHSFDRISDCTRYRNCVGRGPHHPPLPSTLRPRVRARQRALQPAR